MRVCVRIQVYVVLYMYVGECVRVCTSVYVYMCWYTGVFSYITYAINVQ